MVPGLPGSISGQFPVEWCLSFHWNPHALKLVTPDLGKLAEKVWGSHEHKFLGLHMSTFNLCFFIFLAFTRIYSCHFVLSFSMPDCWLQPFAFSTSIFGTLTEWLIESATSVTNCTCLSKQTAWVRRWGGPMNITWSCQPFGSYIAIFPLGLPSANPSPIFRFPVSPFPRFPFPASDQRPTTLSCLSRTPSDASFSQGVPLRRSLLSPLFFLTSQQKFVEAFSTSLFCVCNWQRNLGVTGWLLGSSS